jgi:formate hydrogenlyase subunit 3/multisubunit Na+/H+ antiporter MnhD subunit
MFVFLEIVAISAYSLTAFYPGRDGAEAAFKYLLIGSFASALILLAIVILYTQTGTLNMADLATKMPFVPHSVKITVLVLFIVGFGIEAEMFPLNGWAPDAYSQAPGPIGAVFAGIVVKGGIYALIRIIYTIFDLPEVGEILIVLGVVTMVIAEVAALRQDNLKRMLAFSSIGQMGVVIIAFGIGTNTAMFAALFLMFNHAIIKGLLFMSGSYLVYNTPNKEIKYLSGYGKKMPAISLFFSLGALAIVGLPPFAGFWSKLYILISVADAGLITAVVLVLIASVIEAVYYLLTYMYSYS